MLLAKIMTIAGDKALMTIPPEEVAEGGRQCQMRRYQLESLDGWSE